MSPHRSMKSSKYPRPSLPRCANLAAASSKWMKPVAMPTSRLAMSAVGKRQVRLYARDRPRFELSWTRRVGAANKLNTNRSYPNKDSMPMRAKFWNHCTVETLAFLHVARIVPMRSDDKLSINWVQIRCRFIMPCRRYLLRANSHRHKA